MENFNVKRPGLVVSETDEITPMLIIDKDGGIGQAVVEKLQEQFYIVFVSSKQIKPHKNIINIHFDKKIPVIPDRNYSCMISIFHGEKITREILPSIAEKSLECKARNIIVTSAEHFDKKIEKNLKKEIYNKTILAIHGEIFNHPDFDNNQLSDYISQVRRGRSLRLPGNGLQKTYPIFFDDVRDSVISIAFGESVGAGFVYLLPKHGFTQLAISRVFQKIDPEIRINFSKNKIREVEHHFKNEAQYYFTKYSLENKLKKIELSQIKDEKIKKNKKKYSFKKPKLKHRYAFLILGMVLFVAPLLIELFAVMGGGLFLAESARMLQNGDISTSKRYNSAAKICLISASIIDRSISSVSPLSIVQKNYFFNAREPLMEKIQIGLDLVEVQENGLESYVLMQGIMSSDSRNPKKDFLNVIARVKNIIITLQGLRAGGMLPAEVENRVGPLDHAIAIVGNTIDTYPEVLGFYQNKKYLILFQNNMELRPGGGFIGSYAIATLRNGRLEDLKINDIYDADGQLSVHQEPPYALRRYLGAPHLFMRDSNNDADFIENSRQAKKFLYLETGEKVDGVIAIDTDFVKSLIELYGPLDIHDFNEEVSGENFFMLTETHAEKDFFPGSTQKKDFLRGVYNSLESKIFEGDKISYSLLAQKISDAILQKHLLIAFPDAEYQAVYSVSNLSSTLHDNRLPEDNKYLDFLGLSESNLGMNKSNFYLKRSISQEVDIGNRGEVEERVTVVYQNTSNKNSVFGGDYKNYLRFILPKGSSLDRVEVNGVSIPITSAITDPSQFTKEGFLPPSGLEVETIEEEGKVVFGFLTVIPKGTSQEISISYSPAISFNISKHAFSYDLRVFKQPGTGKDDYSLKVKYPNKFRTIQGQGEFSDVGGKLLYDTKLDSDKNIFLKFSKK